MNRTVSALIVFCAVNFSWRGSKVTLRPFNQNTILYIDYFFNVVSSEYKGTIYQKHCLPIRKNTSNGNLHVCINTPP